MLPSDRHAYTVFTGALWPLTHVDLIFLTEFLPPNNQISWDRRNEVGRFHFCIRWNIYSKRHFPTHCHFMMLHSEISNIKKSSFSRTQEIKRQEKRREEEYNGFKSINYELNRLCLDLNPKKLRQIKRSLARFLCICNVYSQSAKKRKMIWIYQ